MLTIHELRAMRAHMKADAFARQLGPFVLIRKPPSALEAAAAMRLGAGATAHIPPGQRHLSGISLLFQFDELEVATLPPIEGGDTLTVGRLPDNDLVVDHTSVSKRHAQLRWSAGRCTVFDLGSTNGTLINDSPLSSKGQELRDADILSFGDVQFAFLLTASLYRFMGAPPRHTPSPIPMATLPGAPPFIAHVPTEKRARVTVPRPVSPQAFADTPALGKKRPEPPRGPPPVLYPVTAKVPFAEEPTQVGLPSESAAWRSAPEEPTESQPVEEQPTEVKRASRSARTSGIDKKTKVIRKRPRR